MEEGRRQQESRKTTDGNLEYFSQKVISNVNVKTNSRSSITLFERTLFNLGILF